jgi:riboflavin kinase/FMN adenylyltransferase
MRKILEAHVLDFAATAYGKEVEVELLQKIRDSQPFENDEKLKEMIATDITAVREYFTKP